MPKASLSEGPQVTTNRVKEYEVLVPIKRWCRPSAHGQVRHQGFTTRLGSSDGYTPLDPDKASHSPVARYRREPCALDTDLVLPRSPRPKSSVPKSDRKSSTLIEDTMIAATAAVDGLAIRSVQCFR